MSPMKLGRPGGTSIAEEEGNTIKWLAAAVGVGVLIVVVFMLQGGDDEKGKGEATAATTAETTTASSGQGAEIEDDPGPIGDFGETADPAQAAGALEAELQAKRLWSTVEVVAGQPEQIRIQSASCGEAALKAAIGKLAGRMKSSGVTKVECFNRHGSLEFEQGI